MELRRIGISNLLLFQAIILAVGILPLHVNLAKEERKGINIVPRSIITAQKAININMKA